VDGVFQSYDFDQLITDIWKGNKIMIIMETRSREGKKQNHDHNENKIKNRKETRS